MRKAAGFGAHPRAVNNYISIARNLMRSGKTTEAETFLRSTPHLEAMRGEGWAGDDRYGGFFLLSQLSEILLAEGRAAEALPLLNRIRPPADADQTDTANFEALEGETLFRLGRTREAMHVLSSALAAFLVDDDFPQAPDRARLQAVTGLCALALGDRQAAAAHAAQAQAAFEHQPEVSGWYKAPYLELADALKRRPPRTSALPQRDEIRSTSKTSVAFGGITPPAPRAP